MYILEQPGSPELALENISANIPTGQLTGIIGSVGCGKSTVLSLLLNELDIESGKLAKFNTFGFASQEAWFTTFIAIIKKVEHML